MEVETKQLIQDNISTVYNKLEGVLNTLESTLAATNDALNHAIEKIDALLEKHHQEKKKS